jgi:hypothetical protein
MSEAINALVAVAVIVLIVRWVSTSSTPSGASAALGFKPRPITDAMVDTVAAMFPDIPRYAHAPSSSRLRERLRYTFDRDNIRYDLLRTGSPEATTNKILERGFLDAVRVLSICTFALSSRYCSLRQHTTRFTHEQPTRARLLYSLLPREQAGWAPVRR